MISRSCKYAFFVVVLSLAVFSDASLHRYGMAKDKARTEVSRIQKESNMERAFTLACRESANLGVKPLLWMNDTELGSYAS